MRKTVALLRAIETARMLHEPGEGGGEYTRAQAELIVDLFGLTMDDRELVMHLIQRQAVSSRPSYAQTGPSSLPLPKCSEDPYCTRAGVWGATGIMPPGHVWYWVNSDHTAGWLAHKPGKLSINEMRGVT